MPVRCTTRTLPAVVPGTGTDVDDPVAVRHHRLVVLRHVEEVWSDGILDNSTPDPGC